MRYSLPSFPVLLKRWAEEHADDPPELDRYIDRCEFLAEGGLIAEWKLLTVEDYDALLVGQRSIRQWAAWFTHFNTYTFDKVKCAFAESTPPGLCDRKAWWSDMVVRFQQMALKEDADILDILRTVEATIAEKSDGRLPALCKPCATAIKASISDSRRRFWESIPGFFRLDRPKGWTGGVI